MEINLGTLFFICLNVLISFPVVIGADKLSQPTIPSFQCGQALTGELDQTITLEYNVNVSLSSNQRCIWIFRAKNATLYNIHVNQLGFPGSNFNHRLVFHAISPTTFFENFNPTMAFASGDNLNVEGYVLLITFQTGSQNVSQYHGFSLNITAKIGELGVLFDPPTQDFIGSDNSGMVKHPRDDEKYGNNDVSIFVFPPCNSLFNPSKYTEVTLTVLGLAEDCYDTVTVYRFDKEQIFPPYGWTELQVICNETDITQPFTDSDLLMFVFRTTLVTGYKGFELNYTKCLE